MDKTVFILGMLVVLALFGGPNPVILILAGLIFAFGLKDERLD